MSRAIDHVEPVFRMFMNSKPYNPCKQIWNTETGLYSYDTLILHVDRDTLVLDMAYYSRMTKSIQDRLLDLIRYTDFGSPYKYRLINEGCTKHVLT